MNKTKTKQVIIIASVFFLLVTIGLIISMSKIDKQTAETSTFYTATVSNVDITDTGKNISAIIQTKEYKTDLHISVNICKAINMDDVRALKDSQQISFTIENIRATQMDSVEFLPITSLKTATKEIFSLEDYNGYTQTAAYAPRNTAIIFASGCLLVAVYSFIKIRKDKNSKTTM